MNLRILKKLSKRAASLLPLLGDHRKQFGAGHPMTEDPGYIGVRIQARKHWERNRLPHADAIRDEIIVHPARDGRGYIHLSPPSYARKGTVMVGAMEGYYEPEWSEETAWESLSELVFLHFTDFGNGDDPRLTRPLRNPSEIFRAAHDIIAETADV